MADIKFKIGFDVDKSSLSQIKSEVSQISKSIESKGKESGFTKEMKEALKYTEMVDKALDKATNNKLDKINTKTFNEELKKSNTSLSQVYAKLKDAGIDGSAAFRQLNREIRDTGVEVKKSSKLLDEMFDTFGKTVKWGIASSAMNSITGSIQRAVGFTKALDDSLNQIRIVSGKSAVEMEEFAENANQAAKALGKTTTEYTDASLLYFQQGKNAAEVKELTEATLMGANITGTEVSAMADMITSALNGYSMAADKAIYVTDTLAAVGAATGADFEELAVGMSKVASQAATVGVPFEKLNAMLATISETTREAPETIGTSLKTVFARMSEIKLEGSATDEDGVTMSLGKVQDALSLIDVSLLDVNGNMKDMGGVIEEIGEKWEGTDVATKSAITNALAGQRQASRLMALFNQWERYEVALDSAMSATGATMEQNEIRMDSMSYKSQQMRAELERLWMNIINSDVLKGGVDALTSVLETVNNLSESLGGMATLLTGVGSIVISVFSKQLISGFGDLTKGVKNIKTSLKEVGALGKDSAPTAREQEALTEKKVKKGLSDEDFGKYKQEKGKLQDMELEIKSNKKLIELKRETLELEKQYIEVGKFAVKDQSKKSELVLIESKKKALNGIFELEQRMEAYSLADENATYEEFIKTLKAEEVALAGISKEALEAHTSFEELKGSVKNIQKIGDEGFFPALDKEIAEGDALEKELEEIEKQAEETKTAISKINDETIELERSANTQKSSVQGIEQRGLKGFKTEQVVKGIMGVAGAAALAAPAVKALGDDALTTGEKMDSVGNSLMTMSGSLLMSGNPYMMIAGGVALLGGALLKVAKNFLPFENAVKKNQKTLENYKEALSGVKDAQRNLMDAQSKMAEAEAMAADGFDEGELEQYNAIMNEIASSSPQVVAYYDAFGNAVLKSREEVDALNKSLKEQEKNLHASMEAQAGSFGAEVAYLQTQGKKEELILNEQLKRDQEELNQAYESGNAKKIEKAQEAMTETSLALDALRTQFDEIGQKAQETMIDPFIQGTEVFKEMGTELQGYVGGIFNSDIIQKGLEDIGKDGSKSFREIERSSEEYLETFKNRVEKLGGAFASLNKSQDEVSKQLVSQLSKLPQDVQKSVSQQLITMSVGLDEQQMLEEVKSISEFINEQGEMDTFGMVQYFRDNVGPKAKEALSKNIEAGIREGLNNAQAAGLFDEKGFGGMGDSLKQNLMDSLEYWQTAQDITYDEYGNILSTVDKYSEQTQQEMANAVEALKTGNMETLSQILIANDEILNLFESQLQSEAGMNEGWLGQQTTTQYESASAEVLAHIENLRLQKEEESALNTVLDDRRTIYSNTAEAMVESIDGQAEIIDLWNEMVDASSEVMGEGGLFNIDIEAQDEMNDALQESADIMREMEGATDSTQEAYQEWLEKNEQLQDSAKDVGSAFDKMFENMGEEKFGKLAELAGSSIDNIRNLAEEAKKGNIEAAKSLQKEMGSIYGALNKDNQQYFTSFKSTNEARIGVIAEVTGINANQYSTLAEYQNELEKWKSDNVGTYAEWQVKTVQDSLKTQIENMGSAANTQVEINGEMMDATGRASAIAQLTVAKAAVEAAKNGASGGYDAAASMIGNLQGVNEAVGHTLNNITDYLKKDASDIDGLLQRIQAEIDKYAEGGGSVPPIKLGGIKVPTFDDFNFTPSAGSISKPSYTAPSTSTSGGSGGLGDGGGSGGSGGDKGGGGSEEKEVEDLEWEEDIYHDINIQLEQKQQLLDKLQKQQDKLYGKELLDNLAKQKQALIEQQKLLEKKLEMQKQDLANQQKALSSQGVQFNVDGTIANYNQLLAQKVAYVNSLSGEAKEAAKEEFDALVGMMEAYEEMMMNTIVETENAIQDSIDAQREIFLQEFEYEINIQLELSEDFQDALQFLKDMSEGFESGGGDYELTTKQLVGKMGEVKDIQAQIEKINADTSLTDKERIEMLDEQSKLLKDALKDAKGLEEELTKIFIDTLKEGIELNKEFLDGYKGINDELKFLEQTLKLIGEGDNYEVLDQIYQEQYDSMMGQINLLNKQNEVLKEQRAALEAAGMKGSEEWKAINDAILDTQDSLNSLATESLKLLQTEFKNSVDEIMASLENAMTGDMGFDELKKQQKELQEERKKYLDGEEKLIEINKLQKKLQKEIDSTTDPAKKAQLQKFMDTELKNLKEKDKLTKYDVDRANLVYDLTLKQMALEEQRAAKNTMRLVRDTQGNWVYEFTEDAAAVEKAQNDVSDALEKLMQLDKKRLEESQDEMLKLQEEYYKEVQKITQDALNGKYKTEEEYQAALEAATEKYNEKMLVAQEDYEQAKQNATISSLAVILDSYRTTGNELEGLTDEQQEAMRKLAEAVEGDYLGLQGAMDAILNGDEDSIKKAFEDLGITSEGEIAGITSALDTAITNMKDGWQLGLSDMISDMIGGKDGNGGFQEASKNAIQSIMNKWSEYQDKVGNVKNTTGTNLDDIKNRIEGADKATEGLNSETQALIDRFKNGLSAVTSWTTAFQSQRLEIQGLIKDMTDYIKKLDEAIAKKKEEATGVKPGTGNTGAGNSGGTTSPPPAPTPPPAPPKPTGPQGNGVIDKGDRVKVKSANASAWYTSTGTQVADWSAQARAVGKNWNDDFYVYNQANNRVALSKSAGEMALAWVDKNSITGFDTGGYTGAWGNEGKMAMLHEKEIVLNKQDTRNILDAVKLMRESGIADLMRRFGGAMSSITGSFSGGGSEGNNQNITINADFSGVKNSNEIEKAFENMSNMASQYAYRK